MPAESGRFASTVPFYLRYREPYPAAFFQEVATRLPLQGNERLLDVACGPAPLAIGFAPYVASCTGLDPEPGMLTAAREAAADARVKLEIIEGRIEDLTGHVSGYDLVTVGRALHWLARDAALAVFERILRPRGSIAICAAIMVEGPANPWAETYKNVRRAWSPEREEARYRIDLNAWFAGSPFREVDKVTVTDRRQITVSDLIGRALSYSNTSPAVLGERRAEYEAALAEALEPFSENGLIAEEAAAVAAIFR